MSVAQHDRPILRPFRAYYTGSDQLDEGYCLCYDADKGVAASIDPRRIFNVEKPAVGNCAFFAGVVLKKPGPGPCYVDMAPPGSMVNVYAKISSTVGVTRMTVMAGQYYMKQEGFAGAGSAMCLQTLDRATTAGIIQALLEEGPQSGGVEEITPPTTGATGIVMPTGVTYLLGTVTIATGDHVLTCADPTRIGAMKSVICQGTYTTKDITVSFAHHATSDPEVMFYEAPGELDLLMWNGYEYVVISSTSDTA